MFGIAKPCRHVLGPELQREWMGHLCGLCLALRDGHGQAARATTNVDAVTLSIRVDAQREQPLARGHAGPCPLRGMRSATVIVADEAATQHAVAVSLTMAATKLDDHAADGDGLPGRLPRLTHGVSRRWSAAGERAGRRARFQTSILRAAVADSGRRERRPDLTFDDYVAPTEEAAAAAIAHTAVLAGQPANHHALRRLGAAFGRITYLIDAIDDEADDIAAGHFNALVAVCDTPAERRAVGRRLFLDAHRELTDAFDSLVLVRPELARAVVVDQLWRVGDARLHLHHADSCSIHRHHTATGGHEHHGHHGHHTHRGRRLHVRRPAIDLREKAGGMRVLAKVAIFSGIATTAAFEAGSPMPPVEPGVPKRRGCGCCSSDDVGDAAADGCCEGCCCCCSDGCDCCSCDC